jgi:ABC-type sugar transport system ATPase subunit
MLEIKNLSLKKDNTILLKPTSLIFPPLSGLIGQSGEGKSVFIRTLALLEQPFSGEILLNNKPLEKKDLGLILQNFGLFSHLSVLKNLTLSLDLRKKDYKDVNTLVTSFKLTHLLDKKPKQLSGGEQQRVAIVRTLLLEPSVIFYDEPTASLDYTYIETLTSYILSLKNKIQCIVSHDLHFLKSLNCPLFKLKNKNILPVEM